jgi:hypothetical protein
VRFGIASHGLHLVEPTEDGAGNRPTHLSLLGFSRPATRSFWLWQLCRASSQSHQHRASPGGLQAIGFSIMSLVNHDGKTIQLGLWLVLYVTVVVWGSATFFYVEALPPRLR